MEYDPQRRRSIRLPEFDYSQPGMYFVTLVTRERKPILGNIIRAAFAPSQFGEIVHSTWLWLATQYSYVTLDKFCLMPDHVHGILLLDDLCRGGSRTAPTEIKSLGSLVGAFKTVSTKRINEINSTPGVRIWQRNYYEHVIRDERELNRIRAYILANLLRWENDLG